MAEQARNHLKMQLVYANLCFARILDSLFNFTFPWVFGLHCLLDFVPGTVCFCLTKRNLQFPWRPIHVYNKMCKSNWNWNPNRTAWYHRIVFFTITHHQNPKKNKYKSPLFIQWCIIFFSCLYSTLLIPKRAVEFSPWLSLLELRLEASPVTTVDFTGI